MRKRARHSTPVRASDFGALDAPHPYGVLPQGNRLLLQNADATTTKTSTSDAPFVNDECWNHVLTFLDGSSLGRTAQAGRYFYVAAHQPELWRDLVLRRINGGTIAEMETSWKDTYARLFHARTYQKPHTPMAIRGVYSDYLYRLHSTRAFCIPDAWLKGEEGTIPRRREISPEQFFIEFEKPNRPLMMEGAAKSWPAFAKWSDSSYCFEQTKGRDFRATSGVAPLPAQFTLQAYFKYGQMPCLEEAPLYLFDRTALYPGSPLWQDFHPDLCRTMAFWDPAHPQHDLLQYLGEGARPDHTWLILGPRRSGSVFHIDPNATHAWNAAIQGRSTYAHENYDFAMS